MTEARSIEGTEDRAGSAPGQVAHAPPVVERWLVWSGLVPLPAFLILHLGWQLRLSFATDVNELVRPAPAPLVTLAVTGLVWLPLAAHLLLGAWVALRGPWLSRPAADVERPAIVMGRTTALLSLVFVAFHAKHYALDVWLGDADGRDAGLRAIEELASTRWGVPLMGAFYLLGLAATCAHAGLGAHRGFLRLGRLTGAAKRKRSARICAAIAAACFCAGSLAVIRIGSGALLP